MISRLARAKDFEKNWDHLWKYARGIRVSDGVDLSLSSHATVCLVLRSEDGHR